MVVTAASMAHAASTGLPPFWKIMAPAVAASGLPVMATQWRPCSVGLLGALAREPDRTEQEDEREDTSGHDVLRPRSSRGRYRFIPRLAIVSQTGPRTCGASRCR